MLGHDFNSWGVEARRGSIPPLRRPAACHAGVSWWIACPGSRCTTVPAALRPACTCGHGLVGGRHHHHHWHMPTATLTCQCGRGESGWCSDMTSTHGVWRHAGVRFLLSGGLPHAVRAFLGGLLSPSPAARLRPRLFAPPVHVVMGRSGAAATTSTGTCRLPFWLFSVAGVSRAGAWT